MLERSWHRGREHSQPSNAGALGRRGGGVGFGNSSMDAHEHQPIPTNITRQERDWDGSLRIQSQGKDPTACVSHLDGADWLS